MSQITPSASDLNETPLVLVLPFELCDADEEAGRHLAEGVSDELAFALAQLDSLRVMGRGTAAAVRGSGTGVASGVLVGASVVVTGSVQSSDGTLHAELMLATTGDPRREATLTTTLQLETFTAGVAQLADGVARFCGADVTERWHAAIARPLGSSREVADLLLRGRYHAEQRPIGVKLAMQCFDRAIRLDGTAAAAYGALGILWANFGIFLALPPAQARWGRRSCARIRRGSPRARCSSMPTPLEVTPARCAPLAVRCDVSTRARWTR